MKFTIGAKALSFMAAASMGAVLLLSGCGASTGEPEVAPAPAETVAAEPAPEIEAPAEEPAAESAFTVEITGSHQTKDYEGKPTLVVDFTFTNGSDEATAFLFAVSDKAFQEGVQLETAIVTDDKKYDSGNAMKEIKPGTTIEVQSAYLLDGKSEVTIEVTESFSFSDAMLATATIAVK